MRGKDSMRTIQNTAPRNPSPSFSRELLKDQGTERNMAK